VTARRVTPGCHRDRPAAASNVRQSDESRALGLRDYEELGPLTPDNLGYLARRASDEQRRAVLSRWYGFHGAKIAWDEYTRLRAAALTSDNLVDLAPDPVL